MTSKKELSCADELSGGLEVFLELGSASQLVKKPWFRIRIEIQVSLDTDSVKLHPQQHCSRN
jgi:hypothetical protein